MTKVVVRQKKGYGKSKVMTGATTEVLVDGKLMPGLQAISFEVQAKGVAKIKMEMVGEFSLEGEFVLGEFEQQTKEEVDNERKK